MSLVPAGIWLALRLVPAEVMAEKRAETEAVGRLKRGRWAAAVIVGLWGLAAGGLAYVLLSRLGSL